MKIKLIAKTLLPAFGFFFISERSFSQLTPNDFTLLSGPNGTGTTLIGSSITINGGSVGAYKLVQTTGNVTFNNCNIYSADKIILTNSNVASGKIAAAANFPNSPLSTGTILSIGSSTSISGDIDIYGNVVIGGGTVSGRVTLPSPSAFNNFTNYTYSGPTPSGGVVYGSPSLPVLPILPAATSLPPPLLNPPTITNAPQPYGPGSYGNINFGGNKTLTLDGPGTYYFNSFHWSGNSNKLVFDFKNQSGNFIIYVYGDADFGKLNASITNGGNAARISLETQGTGSTSSIAGNAFVIANGSSGGGSKWLGSVYAPNGGINIGSGTGSSTLTGTFASKYSIAIQSGVTVIYSAPCPTSSFVRLDPNIDMRPLAFTTKDSLIATSSIPGTSFSWQAINGGTIISNPATGPKIYISTAGTYIVTASTPTGCSSKDTIVISARVLNLIGAELFSIYQNRTSPNLASSPFFTIQSGYVLIDVIVNAGYYVDVLTALQQNPPYGLIPPYGLSYFPDGESNLMITGIFPINNLLKLDSFNIDAGIQKINFIRTYYVPVSNSGPVASAGDTTMRTWLVRSGYNVTGQGIKIGVISDSYNTIPNSTVHPPDLFNTNNEADDVRLGELPSNVHVLQDFPIRRSDEGRAMLELAHDIAPGAELYFRTGYFTKFDFALGIKQLRDAGCKIIVDDMTYLDAFSLKDDVVARTVDTVVNQGVTYFSAAGNFDKQSYEKAGNFIDATSIGFAGKKAHNFGGGDMFQQIKLRPGNYVFVLQWLDDDNNALYDLDFYLTPNTNGTGLIGFNRASGHPIEFIPIKIVGNSDTDTTSKVYNVLIINNTASGNPALLKYIVFKRDAAANIQFMEYIEGTSTCIGQANAVGAIAVGAARFDKAQPYLNPPLIESFSSTGGSKTNNVLPLRLKPDIVAPDGVRTNVALGGDYPPIDGFSSFFGTSAAAPQAAAAAALIMECRRIYLGQNVVSPAQIKSLLQTSATDMETPGFDFISGAGLINIDMTMRTFAAPRPHIDALIVPAATPPIIPGDIVFTVTIKGNNFRPNSIAYFRDSALASTVILDTVNGIATAVIPKFEGNPPIRMYTPPYPNTNGTDGGFSNNAYFFENRVVVKAVSYSLKYGDPIPTVLDTIITINDTLLQNSRYTLADLGFDKDSLHIETDAVEGSDVGTYEVKVYRNFTPGNSADSALLKKFSYKFINGQITIAKFLVKVVPDDINFIYGHAVPTITYKYYDENNALITDPFLLHILDSSHHESLPENVLAVVSGYPSSGLTNTDIQNMSGMVSFQAIKNSRKFTTLDGELIPAPEPSGFDVQYIVDVAAQSIKNFKTSSLDDDILITPYPGVHPRAMLKASALMNGTAKSGFTTNSLVPIVNGQLVPVVNSEAGDLVPIVNGELVQLVNGAISVNGELRTVNGELVQLVNGELVQLVNGELVPVINGELVQIVNGELVQLVNGELVPLVNGELVQLVNVADGVLVQMVNGELVQLINGQLVPVINGELVQIVNGELVQLVNGEPIPNGELVQLVNGELVQLVNGELVQLVNGTELPIADGLVQIVNGELVQLVNGELVPLINGELVQLVNGELVPLVNSYSSGPGNNENAAVIIDSDDLDVQDGFLGGMFSTNIITGLDVGEQKILSGTVANSNFAFTYGLGTATVTADECLQIHTPFKNFGNTTQKPTSLWLNVVTKVSGQLTEPGDYLLFKRPAVTFNFISSTPLISNFPIPDGKIVAVTPRTGVTYPRTYFDVDNNTWVTEVPVNFASTSDIFVTGGIINSSTGFQKLNGNTNTVIVGRFYSNKSFSDQWAHAIAAYQLQQSPPTPPYEYVTYEMLGDTTDIGSLKGIVSINGTYRAATPLPILNYLVQGASGGGGNNYTGSKSSFQAFSACDGETATQRTNVTSLTMEEVKAMPLAPQILIHPNPASDLLNLSFVPSQTGISKLEMFTINGAKVFEADYGVCEAGNRYLKKINVSKLVNGIYLVRLSNAGTVTNKKIVIAH
jgi:hypothetical protein